MTERRPPTEALLIAVREYFERDLLPELSGRHRFMTRVSINVLATVIRELTEAPGYEDTERLRLLALIGGGDDLAGLNERLAAAIRDGAIDPDDPDLIRHIKAATEEALRINNPKWLAD